MVREYAIKSAIGMPNAIDSAKPPSVAVVVGTLSRHSRGHSTISCLTTACGDGIRYGGIRKMTIASSHSTSRMAISSTGLSQADRSIFFHSGRVIEPSVDSAQWRKSSWPVSAYLHDFHCVRPARFAHRLADGQHDEIAALDLALVEQQFLRGAQHFVAIVA